MTWIPLGYRKAHRTLTGLLLALGIALLATPCGGAEQNAAQGKGSPSRGTGDAPGGQATGDKTINVAAAADMQPVFAVFQPIFEKQTGYTLKISYGSSATLSQQIRNGSPADIFFSADYAFAEQVVADNLSDNKTPTPYAKGLLALWTRNGSRFPTPLTLEVLRRKDLKTIAIANPDRAPYGRAAVAALKTLRVYDGLKPHIVEAESIAQAAQFALSGNAELALISQTIAVSPNYKSAGHFTLIPFSQYPEIRQCAVILKKGHAEEAHRLLKFMLSPQVQDHLSDLGLQPSR